MLSPDIWLLFKLAAGTLYVAYVISSTDGPWHVFTVFRERVPLGGLLACFVCLAIWVAVILFLLQEYVSPFVGDVLAIAGVALFAWRWTGGSHV